MATKYVLPVNLSINQWPLNHPHTIHPFEASSVHGELRGACMASTLLQWLIYADHMSWHMNSALKISIGHFAVDVVSSCMRGQSLFCEWVLLDRINDPII